MKENKDTKFNYTLILCVEIQPTQTEFLVKNVYKWFIVLHQSWVLVLALKLLIAYKFSHIGFNVKASWKWDSEHESIVLRPSAKGQRPI